MRKEGQPLNQRWARDPTAWGHRAGSPAAGRRGRHRLGRPGPAVRLGARRAPTRFCRPPLHPWPCVLWPWEARRTERRNPACRRERGRTSYSCAGEGGTGRSSREKSENEPCAGGLPAPEGIKHHQPLQKKKPTNQKKASEPT